MDILHLIRAMLQGRHGACPYSSSSEPSREICKVLSLEIHVDVEPEKRREFLLAAESLLGRIAAEESSCQDRRVFEQHGDPNHFLWREEWLDRAALDRRMASSAFRALLGALRVLGQAHDLRITSVEQKSNEEMVT